MHSRLLFCASALLALWAPAGMLMAQANKKPAPQKPAPAAQKSAAPAKNAGAAASGTGGAAAASPEAPADPNRSKALVRAITAQEKSEQAGEVFKQFIEGTPEQRAKLVADQAKYGAEALKYFKESPNRDFKPVSIQILGTVTSPSAPDRMFFPYFVATDKNLLGFVTVVVETKDGFKVDWNSFSRGHDQNLEKFLDEKKPGSSMVSLVGVSKTHIFGDGPPGGEAKNDAYSIEMPPPPALKDPAKAFVVKTSETGKQMSEKLGWSRGHLCWLTLSWEGSAAAPLLQIKAYQPYAR